MSEEDTLFARRMRMVEAMRRKAYTDDELAAISGMSKSAVQRWRRSIQQRMHIEGYAEDARGRVFTPKWRWGEGEDAPRPGPRWDAAERMRRMRLRRKNPDLY